MQKEVNKADQEYEYDVFLSFTGADREMKNYIREHLELNHLKCYDSDLYCNGQFREDYCKALDKSRVYLMILTDNLRSVPKFGEGTLSEVRSECSLARELEAHNQLNIVILCASEFFMYNTPYHNYNDKIGWFFYCATRGFSQIRAVLNDEGVLAGHILEELSSRCAHLVKQRNEGTPELSQAPHIEIARERLLPPEIFKGRKQYIKAALDAFEEGSQVVVLSGLGGIGKTTLAVEIARHSEEIAFLHCPQTVHVRELGGYGGGLHTLTSSVRYTKEIYDKLTVLSEEDKDKLKLDVLARIPETELLIIDNYNTVSDKDIEQIISVLKCRLIITTRANLSTNNEGITVLTVEALPYEQAYDIFCQISRTAVNGDTFKSIYTFIGGHTITLCVMAKMMSLHKFSAEDLLNELGQLDKFDAKVDFPHNEYGDADTVLGHLRKLFDISGFSDEAKRILRSMSILGDGTIALSDIMSVLGLRNRNEINELTGNGWLEHQIRKTDNGEAEYLYLHPILSRLMANILVPTEENTAEIIQYLLKKTDEHRGKMTYADAALLADKLYYACYVLADKGKLAVQLWNKFTDVNYLLGDGDVTENRAKALAKRIKDDTDSTRIISYADMVFLSLHPKRVDILDRYVAALDENSHDYKWVMRQLSVTLSLILTEQKYSSFVNQSLEKAIEIAMIKKDDFALCDLFEYCSFFTSDIKPMLKKLKAYLKVRKKEGVRDGAVSHLEFMILAYGLFGSKNFYDFFKKSYKIMDTSLIKNKTLPTLFFMLTHPFSLIRSNMLFHRIKNLDTQNDPYALFLQTCIDETTRVISDRKINASNYISAFVNLHKYKLYQQTTLRSTADMVKGCIWVLNSFPKEMIISEANMLANNIDTDNFTVLQLSEYHVALLINREYGNSDAVIQAKNFVKMISSVRPKGHPDIISAKVSYAEICKYFGKEAEALNAYMDALQDVPETGDSIITRSQIAKEIIYFPSLSMCPFETVLYVLDTAVEDVEEGTYEYCSILFSFEKRVAEWEKREGGAFHTYNQHELIRKYNLITALLDASRNIKKQTFNEQKYILEIARQKNLIELVENDFKNKKELFDVFKRYMKSKYKEVRLRAKIFLEYFDIYGVLIEKGYSDISCMVSRLVTLSAVCLKNKILQYFASQCIRQAIYRAVKNNIPLLNALGLKKKKLLGIIDDKYLTRYIMLTEDSRCEKTRASEFYIAEFLKITNELEGKYMNIRSTQYRKFRSPQKYFTVVLKNILSALYEKDGFITSLCNLESKENADEDKNEED